VAKHVLPRIADRGAVLLARRNLKMARSAHAYVRGNTVQFYEWLSGLESDRLPHGPAVWICGDCHVGNLGPVVDVEGRIRIEIRDLDQTVVGNPAHDLIRLALSLASAARGSDLPGVTTARVLEAIVEGYEAAFADEQVEEPQRPDAVKLVLGLAAKRRWRHLARERLDDVSPTIPLGKRFWPISEGESVAVRELFDEEPMQQLATMLRSREDGAGVRLLDAAYWMKGCSSLGFLRYAVLLDVVGDKRASHSLCLMDIKEAVAPAAPSYPNARMPKTNGERVVAGARALSPSLGDRMRSAALLERSVFVRELLPQDLKVEMEQLTVKEAMLTARYLATVVGVAHARQMSLDDRRTWQHELARHRTKLLDAPSWLWTSVVELLVNHEGAYLEHCRRYARELDGSV
jgi:uncharacterized protein (DUF2252 family)